MNSMMSEAQQHVALQGEEVVVEVEFPFRHDESVQSLENKIKALHRSMSKTRRNDDAQVLTVINPQPGPRSLCRISSSVSLQSSSVDSDTTESSAPRTRRKNDGISDNGHWGYFAGACPRETQLALAGDKTRSLLQSQQMIHML